MPSSTTNPFELEKMRARLLRDLKKALVAFAMAGSRRDLEIVRLVFEMLAELRGA